MPDSSRGRRAGVLLPLFSARSSRSWGIGEIGDVGVFASWLREAGLRTWLMLPINEMSAGQHSPYSALTAMAIDPVYISLRDVHDYVALGGDAALDPGSRAEIDNLRGTPRIEWDRVRALKMRALRHSFTRFDRDECSAQTPRALAFAAWVVSQAWWVEDYALFRALHTYHGERPVVGMGGRQSHPSARRHRAGPAVAGAPKCASPSTCSGLPTSSGTRRDARPMT